MKLNFIIIYLLCLAFEIYSDNWCHLDMYFHWNEIENIPYSDFSFTLQREIERETGSNGQQLHKVL